MSAGGSSGEAQGGEAGSNETQLDPSFAFLSPVIDIENGALGAAMTGRFTLQLSLGSASTDSATVESVSFELSQGDGSVLMDPLPFDVDGLSFPVVLPPGATRAGAFTLKVSRVLSSEQQASACSSGLVIREHSSGASVSVQPTCH